VTGATWSPSRADAAASPRRGAGVMAAIGDSWSAGAHESDVPWPTLLADRLQLDLYNFAVFGAFTGEVLHRQLPAALGVRPDLLCAVCGANDVLSTTRLDVDRFATDLEAVFEIARARIPGVLLVTATIPDLTRFVAYRPRSRASKSRAFAEVSTRIRSIARRQGAICVDVASAAYVASRQIYAEDGFHPSPVGQSAVFEHVLRELRAHPAARRYA
jgi:lysophospholipase L1-like esterase